MGKDNDMELVRLRTMFVGRRVKIIDSARPSGDNNVGICSDISRIPGTDDKFNIELPDCIYGFQPQTLTENLSDGPLDAAIGGNRRIELVPEDKQ